MQHPLCIPKGKYFYLGKKGELIKVKAADTEFVLASTLLVICWHSANTMFNNSIFFLGTKEVESIASR